MQALRQIEATIDSVVTVLSNSIPGFVTASSAAGAQVSAHPPLSLSCAREPCLCVSAHFASRTQLGIWSIIPEVS
jgi:hypothetical protein